MDKLFLIDGHALVFKMYYAFLRKPMINSKGADMSILFGFTKYLLEMVEREKPTHLAVAFDPPGGTFRNELYPAYKGTRPPTPQLIIDALEPLTELVQAMNIPVLMIKGFEADDVIGSMALRSAREGVDVYMVTPDKDYGQLIAEHIYQYKPGKAGGDDEVIDRTAICQKWGILDPVQIIDMLAICGDTADNVPGVKGVGEVGAGKLVSKYGSIENIYAHLDDKTDIPLETTADDMRMDMNFSPEIADLFEKYEFNSLKRFITHVGPSAASQTREEFIVNEIAPNEMVKAVRKAGCCGLITEAYGEGIFSPVKRLIIGCDGQACAVPGDRLDSVKDILEDAAIDKYGYDLKLQANLLKHAGIDLAGKWLDIALMHYLVDPEKSHAVDILSRSYLNIELDEAPTDTGTGSLFDEAPEAAENVRSREAAALVLLGRKVREELADRQKLYDEMEEPLAKVLAKMERAGVKVDLKQLDHFAKGLREEMVAREAHIREMVGEPDLNISSPKQVGDVLFDKLKLDPKAKKSARGQYSTDEATLLAIADRHPVVNEILEFRAVKKLLSTYIEPFPTYVSPVDGRVHTTFNQALTATGRLSSSNPNLQNIPIRTERGKEIRKAFIPGTPEGVIVSADYSQIELRIMAHLSCDEHLVKAFRDGDDVHAATAAKIYGIPISEVTREQRGRAKTANFGIMYGISSFGLAQRLNLGRKEAKELIDGYFASFPAIRSFIDDSIGFARENGYVETLFGRRRYLPDINAKNATVRALAERNAVNAPIQGTAADIIKLAMIRVDQRIEEAGLKSRMVLQIHDELMFDALPEEVPQLKKIVVEVMENVLKLSVPLTVECSDGKNWLEAH